MGGKGNDKGKGKGKGGKRKRRVVDPNVWEGLPIDEQAEAMINDIVNNHGGFLSNKDCKAMINSVGFTQKGRGCKRALDLIAARVLYKLVAQTAVKTHSKKLKRGDVSSAEWAVDITHEAPSGMY